MAVKATIGGGGQVGTLSFNEIIGYTPGQGRGDAKKNCYQNVNNGNILVVFGVNAQLVEYERRPSGKRTNRTGLTRAGMFVIEKKTGKLRPVTADRSPDGKKVWVPYSGSITIGGNPHVIQPGQNAQAAGSDEYDDEDGEA